ncbi:MAG: transposase [bacterium]
MGEGKWGHSSFPLTRPLCAVIGSVPRTARDSVGGLCYHLLNRGNRRARVFHSPGDYRDFVPLMGQACTRLPMRILAYCLIPNHFHLVLWPHKGGDLGRWLQWLMTTQVRRHHLRHRSSGHLWQGRFKAFPIQEDEHLLTVLRYVEANPPRAGLVSRAQDWEWSSLHRPGRPKVNPTPGAQKHH